MHVQLLGSALLSLVVAGCSRYISNSYPVVNQLRASLNSMLYNMGHNSMYRLVYDSKYFGRENNLIISKPTLKIASCSTTCKSMGLYIN